MLPLRSSTNRRFEGRSLPRVVLVAHPASRVMTSPTVRMSASSRLVCAAVWTLYRMLGLPPSHERPSSANHWSIMAEARADERTFGQRRCTATHKTKSGVLLGHTETASTRRMGVDCLVNQSGTGARSRCYGTEWSAKVLAEGECRTEDRASSRESNLRASPDSSAHC